MGNQPQAQTSSVGVEEQPVTSRQANKEHREKPYSLTPEAAATYASLKEENHLNDYLSVQTQQEEKSSFKTVQRFRRLVSYDAFYSGQWRQNFPHGKGRVIFPDGSMVVGYFNNNYCNGRDSFYIFANGGYYRGTIEHNKIAGKGKYSFNGFYYDGQWRDGLPHGQGIQQHENGDRYQGRFQNGKKHGSDCEMIWKNHSTFIKYKGSFKLGRIQGLGCLSLKGLGTVEGHFEQDIISNAVYTSSKYKYTGTISLGRLSGKGKIELLELKDVYQGQFREGQLNGECRVVDSKQRHYSRFFVNGKQVRDVQGFTPQQQDQILSYIQKAYNSQDYHSDVTQSLKAHLGKKYRFDFVEPFQTTFRSDQYLVVDAYSKVLLVTPHNLP